MTPEKPRRIEFTCDGRIIEAEEGQSIAAALWAYGDRALSRSTKFHRPRGWACGTGDCANCTMEVDDVPNVRTCIEPAKNDSVVIGQNAWPNVRHDLFRVNDVVFRKGLDHHRGFVRPRILYPLFGRVIRAFAGWGRTPKHVPPQPKTETRRSDIVIVGAGPAGLAAATAAGQAGAQVLLIDRYPQPGGLARWLAQPLPDPDAEPPGSGKKLPGHELAQRWEKEARETGRVVYAPRSTLSALYPNGIHLIHNDNTIRLVKANTTILATGGLANEQPFEGNDLPGVMNATGCLALLNREGVRPGRRAVIYGAGAHGLTTAMELHAQGTQIQAILEPAETAPGPDSLVKAVQNRDIPLWTGSRIRRAHGWGRLRRVTCDTKNGRKRLDADLLVVAMGAKTLPFAMQGLGAQLKHDPARGGTVPILNEQMMTSVPGLFATGDAAGIGSLASARLTGRLAGLGAAAHAGHPSNDDMSELTTLQRRLHELGVVLQPHTPSASAETKTPDSEKELVR